MTEEQKAGSETGEAIRKRPTLGAHIERLWDHNADTRSLFLRLPHGARIAFLPGQFISVVIPLPGEKRVRPYSIASDPETPELLEICFNRVPSGSGAAWLFERRAGDELEFTGPFGMFTLERPPGDESVFLAAGTAIAPIRPMVRRALASPNAQRLTLLYAAPDSEHLLYHAELERMAGESSGRLHFETFTTGAADPMGLLCDEARRRWVDGTGTRSRHFYICGVGSQVIALRSLLRGAGYERGAVHYEKW